MDFTSPGTVQRPKALPSVIMKLLLLAACLALGDGQEMEHGNIVEELTKAGLRKFLMEMVVDMEDNEEVNWKVERRCDE